MTQKEAFELVVGLLDKAEFQYMICGSVAASLYGRPRFTNDMDLVIAILPQRAREFYRLFDQAGFYCPPPEILENELASRGQFNLLHHETGTKVDCIVLKTDAFSREEFRRRQRRPFSRATDASLARPEDVILGKLRFYQMGGSDKHLHDIRGILDVSGDIVDCDYLNHWVKELGLEAEWQKAQQL